MYTQPTELLLSLLLLRPVSNQPFIVCFTDKYLYLEAFYKDPDPGHILSSLTPSVCGQLYENDDRKISLERELIMQ